eukprot:CAMPEP_0171063986 /NCGR_PEP_ID=MMETSP0766_2-20121228/6008_1 /TAXON_ID=439317 /ORGANISM="Gambierdiscus australes, Strain CAWD 149" /LENGTH=70 /DNA_ID=CAMNT_0011519967 /DNA_START=43 /DNA_END=255 /DNA_ORIENTATION=+
MQSAQEEKKQQASSLLPSKYLQGMDRQPPVQHCGRDTTDCAALASALPSELTLHQQQQIWSIAFATLLHA